MSDSGPIRTPAARRLRFGPFELDLAAGVLRRAGAPVKLAPQPVRVLSFLAANPGRVVDRDTLRREIWGERASSDHDRGLNFCVLRIRAALGDDAEAPRYLETLPKRGFRFVAPVEVERAVPQRAPRRPLRRARWPLLAGVAATALAGWTTLPPGHGATPAERPMLAVLPFTDLDPQAGALVEGLTEELITELGRLDPQALGVIARSSVLRYREHPAPLSEIRRELGVAYLLEGSVRQAAGRTRVVARLVRADDETLIWSESYERASGGGLALQSELAGSIAEAVAPTLLPGTRRRARAASPGDEPLQVARSLMLQGGADRLQRALEFLERALALDPEAAPAWVALADAHHRLRMSRRTPGLEAAQRALDAATRAVALDPELAEAHHVLGLVQLWHAWDPLAAGASLRRALELDPGSARAHHDDAWHWIARERPEAALAAIRRARRIDPISPRANCDVGWVLLRARRHGEAAAACRRSLDIEPGYPEAESCLATAALRLGHPAEALPELLASLRESGVEASRLARIEGLTSERALEQVREWRLERLQQGRPPDHYHVAVEQAVLGRGDAALASLEAALAERQPSLAVIGSDPELDPLRADPRFAELLRRVAATRPLG